MFKKPIFVSLILMCSISVFAQSSDPVVLSYQRNFIRASISTKIELLNDASRITTISMVPLYADAVRFVTSQYPILGADAQLIEIGAVSAAKSAQYQDQSILGPIKELFAAVPDSRVRIACLNTLASVSRGRKEEVDFINKWFSESVGAALSGKTADIRVLSAAAETLGKIGASSSFAVLFEAATSSVDSSVALASTNALNAISEGYTDNILAIINGKGIKEMYAAFSFSLKKASLTNTDRGKIAEAAFTRAVSANPSQAEEGAHTALVGESMKSLTALKWSQASPAVVKYFYRVQGEYRDSDKGVEALVPVVNCMGAMATTESAQALSIFLGLLNSETEQKKTYNEQVLLAVIQALGELGDKTAFDYLLYVGYLDYPESVKQASRDALARLQW